MLFLGKFKEGIAPDISVVLVSCKNFNKRVCKKKVMKVYATIFILFHRLSCTRSSSSSSSSNTSGSSCSSSSVVLVVSSSRGSGSSSHSSSSSSSSAVVVIVVVITDIDIVSLA